METDVKSGKEIIDDFFSTIKDLEGVDPAIADALISLHETGKLTEKSIVNALLGLKNVS